MVVMSTSIVASLVYKNSGSFSETSTGRQYDLLDLSDPLLISSFLFEFMLLVALC